MKPVLLFAQNPDAMDVDCVYPIVQDSSIGILHWNATYTSRSSLYKSTTPHNHVYMI